MLMSCMYDPYGMRESTLFFEFVWDSDFMRLAMDQDAPQQRYQRERAFMEASTNLLNGEIDEIPWAVSMKIDGIPWDTVKSHESRNCHWWFGIDSIGHFPSPSARQIFSSNRTNTEISLAPEVLRDKKP